MEHKCKKNDIKTVEKCELNREQVKKELVLFIDDNPVELHFHHKKTSKFLSFLKLVLAVITTDEQKIKELTEENERQRSEISVKRKLLDKAEVRMDCLEEVNKVLQADICNATMNLEHLTKENERLSAYNENLIKTNTYLSNHLLDEVQQAKDLAIADTVKEMKERIIENACSINMVNSEGQVIKNRLSNICR